MRFVFHLVPFIPLMMGRYFLAIAFFLLVLLAYIKTEKLKAMLEGFGGNHESGEAQSIERAIKRWESVTFWPELRRLFKVS